MIGNRRQLLQTIGILAGTMVGARGLFAATPAAGKAYEITHTEAEWKKILPPDEFAVLRQAGTERPHSGPLDKEMRAGMYSCAGCALPLFSSDKKFISSTGWPSFWAPIKGAVDEAPDATIGMVRTEILCHRCGGHLGHVFDDGPKPTGLRYCMNGLALKFRTA